MSTFYFVKAPTQRWVSTEQREPIILKTQVLLDDGLEPDQRPRRFSTFVTLFRHPIPVLSRIVLRFLFGLLIRRAVTASYPSATCLGSTRHIKGLIFLVSLTKSLCPVFVQRNT